MNFSKATCLLIGILAPLNANSSVQAAFFDLFGAQGAELEGALSNSTTVGGITATLTANSGTLNQTTNRFGVNATGSGDDPDTLDDGEGAESITITFNVDVFLDQIQLSVFSVGEQGSILIAGGTPTPLAGMPQGDDEFDFSNAVLTSQSIVLSWVSGNGFSFDDFSVSLLSPVAGDFDGDGDRDGADFIIWQRDLGDSTSLALWEANFGVPAMLASSTAVPEPANLSLPLLAALGLVVSLRRKV